VAGRILRERVDLDRIEGDFHALEALLLVAHDRENTARAQVAEQVAAAERGHGCTAVHVSTHDRAGHVVAVSHQGSHHASVLAMLGGYAIVALVIRPPVVLAAAAASRLHVTLFHARVADVADPQVAGRPIETEPPRVAQAVGPDLWAGAGLIDKRVGG